MLIDADMIDAEDGLNQHTEKNKQKKNSDGSFVYCIISIAESDTLLDCSFNTFLITDRLSYFPKME